MIRDDCKTITDDNHVQSLIEYGAHTHHIIIIHQHIKYKKEDYIK